MAGERVRVSSGTAPVIMLSMSMLLFHCKMVESHDHTVGGDKGNGWLVQASGTYSEWAKNQTLKAGDYLVFNYNASLHNVYSWIGGDLTFDTPLNATRHVTGADKIRLGSGANRFVCTIPGHCDAGMKFTATTVA